MNLLNFLFRSRRSANVARERLQILLAHERAANETRSGLLSVLREEILAVVARHVDVSDEHIRIVSNQQAQMSVLEIEIEIPRTARTRARLAMSM